MKAFGSSSNLFPLLFAGVLFLSPHAAKADSVPVSFPGTGLYDCSLYTIFNPFYPDCVDTNYNSLQGPGLAYIPPEPPFSTPLVGEAGTFAGQGPPAGIKYVPATGGWDFPDGDSGCCTGVFDWYTQFDVSGLPASCDTYADAFGNSNCEMTIVGGLSAEGYVGMAVGGTPGDGFGGYISDASNNPILFTTANETGFSMTIYASNGANFADFIFTGCNTYNPAADPINPCFADQNTDEPIVGLYVDPSWTIAPPGTPVDDIPESTLIADGGIEPVTSVPEPGSLPLLGSALLAIVGMSILRKPTRPRA
ncbi:MAG TPA: PEP-CTERM sorting domain-containing protein [Bryobacteraceae bacterium]|nr:PEP-CTERM sorting domain-containing protein [Bryobacteraceae bacterium]